MILVLLGLLLVAGGSIGTSADSPLAGTSAQLVLITVGVCAVLGGSFLLTRLSRRGGRLD